MATLSTKSYVMGSGDKATAKYVLVAEQPGRNEVEQRRPMVGPAGINLNECLREVGIDRDECYITNVYKDLDYDLKYYFDQRKKPPIQPPGQAYINVLKGELAKTGGVIIAMGNAALYALTDRLGINNWRGSVVESTLLPGRKVVPTFHPATWTQEKLFRDPKLYLNRHMVILDLHRAKAEYGYTEVRKTPRHVIIRPTFDESIAFLNKCMKQSRVYYDIELLNNEMSCISFAYNAGEAICIPFVDQTGQYFTVDEERRIMLKIQQILESDITKGGQNIIFDSHFIHARYGIQTINRDDTMIAQGILYPEYPKRLQFITALWTDINYYKSDGKIWLEGGGDWNNGFVYNGMDSIACAAAFPRQMAELEETNNLDAYQRQVELVEPLTYMMEHGVRIDIPGFANKVLSNQMALQQKEAEIHAAMGEVSPASPTQLMNYFYRQKGIKPITNKKHRETTDESALIELAGKGHHEAQLILDWRELDKLASTYLSMNKVDKDGRMRCSYNPVGTRYGRISSSKNIFGTGMNMQNLPPDIRTYFIADPGYVIYSIDLSQAENRLVAYIGNIVPMIEAFETGVDVHRLTASLIYGVKYEEVSIEQREWGKRANHGFNYGYGPASFSRLYQVPMSRASRIKDAYFEAYPAVRTGYWAYVEDQLRRNNRTLSTLFGRRIRFLQQYGEKLKNEAYSAIPQGTVGEIINERGIKYIYYNYDVEFKYVEILTQTHDSLDFQIPKSAGFEAHARVIHKVIASLEAPLKFRQTQIKIPCDLVVNFNLNKKLGIEIKHAHLPKDEPTLARTLSDKVADLETSTKRAGRSAAISAA